MSIKPIKNYLLKNIAKTRRQQGENGLLKRKTQKRFSLQFYYGN